MFDWFDPDLLFILAAVAWWVFSAVLDKKKPKKDEPAQSPKQPSTRQAAPDPNQGAEARRIREAIQRKIAERSRAEQEPARAHPTAQTPEHRTPTPVPAYEAFEDDPQVYDYETAISEVRQQQEVSRKKLEDTRRQHAKRSPKQARVARTTPVLRSLRAEVLSDLRHPQSVRKAILMREILDTPVGLR